MMRLSSLEARPRLVEFLPFPFTFKDWLKGSAEFTLTRTWTRDDWRKEYEVRLRVNPMVPEACDAPPPPPPAWRCHGCRVVFEDKVELMDHIMESLLTTATTVMEDFSKPL